MGHYTPVTFETIKKLREEAAKKREEEIYKLQIETHKRKWEGVTFLYEKAMAHIRADPDASSWSNIIIPAFKQNTLYSDPEVIVSMLKEVEYVFPDFTITQMGGRPWIFQFALKEAN